MTKFIAIVAYDQEFGIAKDNSIPWDLPNDKWLYRQLIADNVVIRSRYTFANGTSQQNSPRRHIIVTRKPDQNAETASSLAEIKTLAQDEELVYVCGGQDIYMMLSPEISSVIATEINGSYSCDRFFPNFHLDWPRQLIANFSTTESEPSAELYVYNR